jgi:hypothetical protein
MRRCIFRVAEGGTATVIIVMVVRLRRPKRRQRGGRVLADVYG